MDVIPRFRSTLHVMQFSLVSALHEVASRTCIGLFLVHRACRDGITLARFLVVHRGDQYCPPHHGHAEVSVLCFPLGFYL